MSLYNALFGENKEAPVLLGMLGVNKEYFRRYRDIDLIESATKIRVFTRLGGGNRPDYKDTWNKIRKHDLYIKDYDDDFDCTYAFIEYKIPDEFKETAKKMFEGEPVSFSDKFKKELEEMDKEGTEAYKRSQMLAKKFEDAIKDSENNSGNIHFIEF